MGCSISKLENEEAIQICKDRKNFIKQAVEQRTRFASNHIAYIHSLKRVSDALRDYVDEDEPREFLLDSFKNPYSKKKRSNFLSESPKSNFQINYLRPSGTPSVVIEEEPPQILESVQYESYSSINSNYAYYSNDTRSYPPPLPQYSQWDFSWNPFSSLDYYNFQYTNSIDQGISDDDIYGLRKLREQEGIPELEEETEHEEFDKNLNVSKERDNSNKTYREEVIIDDDEDDDDECDHIDCTECDSENKNEKDMLKTYKGDSVEILKDQSVGQVSKLESAIENRENKKEAQGFMVYVNRRPTSIAEVIKDLETHFMIICSAGDVVSDTLEASNKAHFSSSSNDMSAAKMLNKVPFLGSASSLSSSSKSLVHTPTSKDESYEINSDLSDESCIFLGSHQTTLDRLYVWEKKLYDQVREGERLRIAYEKKCSQLRDKVAKGDDHFSAEKTRKAIRDLYTRIKVSIHSVEAISKRIETLRDEELQPQLLELVQGLGKMWRTMAESHRSQKHTLNEAKILLSRTPSKKLKTKNNAYIPPSDPNRLASSASNLEAELRNWQSCFQSYITSQRLYIHALANWLLRCIQCDAATWKLPFCPSLGGPPIYGVCIQWSRSLDDVREDSVIDGLDFFAAGMGSIYAQYSRDENKINTKDFVSVEKMAEVGIKVVCAGMSVAVSSLTEFAIGSAELYDELVDQSESAKCTVDTAEPQS